MSIMSIELGIDENVLNDFDSLTRKDFLNKYRLKYEFYYETRISIDMYEDGYADLRGFNYYVLPSYTLIGRNKYKRITHNYNEVLLKDALTLVEILEDDFSPTHLLVNLVNDIYLNYAEGYFSNDDILDIIRKVIFKETDITVQPSNKKFKLLKSYWEYNTTFEWKVKNGEIIIDWSMVTAIVRKMIKDKDIRNMFDDEISLEENIKLFKDYGLKVSMKYLVEWCDKHDIIYFRDKDTIKEIRDRVVINMFNKGKSEREIEKYCREKSIKICKSSVHKIIGKHIKKKG